MVVNVIKQRGSRPDSRRDLMTICSKNVLSYGWASDP